jgi:hypothetical protein
MAKPSFSGWKAKWILPSPPKITVGMAASPNDGRQNGVLTLLPDRVRASHKGRPVPGWWGWRIATLSAAGAAAVRGRPPDGGHTLRRGAFEAVLAGSTMEHTAEQQRLARIGVLQQQEQPLPPVATARPSLAQMIGGALRGDAKSLHAVENTVADAALLAEALVLLRARLQHPAEGQFAATVILRHARTGEVRDSHRSPQ